MPRCLSRYSELPEEGYSAGALTHLSDGRVFPSRLDFTRADVVKIRAETMERMSISGVQDKISLKLERGTLVPTASGGEYILKPIPGSALPERTPEVPANESLTMQLASQIYGINTAANGLIRLADGELAYITRRFDRTRDGEKIAQEDFCQLMKRTPYTTGKNFKYDASYQELADTLRRYCPAYAIESEKLFRRIVFSYRVGNGDAHLKNFSVRQTSDGDYILSPAYDLMCTRLHLPTETRLALDLFENDEIPTGVRTHGFPTGADFLELANRMGLVSRRAERILDELLDHDEQALALIERSFLDSPAQTEYWDVFEERGTALRIRTSCLSRD